MKSSLERVACVTGATGALGQEICKSLAARGFSVGVLFNQNQDLAQSLCEELETLSGKQSHPVPFDLASMTSIENAVEHARSQFGRVDVWINNAAINKMIPFKELDLLTEDVWREIIDINLTGQFRCARVVGQMMQRQGSGHIINIASVSGLAASGSSIAYSVAKAGLIHLSRCLAVALAPNIQTNCVAPGFMEGTGTSSALSPAHQKKMVESSLLGRPVILTDVANMVTELTQNQSVTGQVFVVDCGRHLH